MSFSSNPAPRESWLAGFFAGLAGDLRYACRRLGKSRGFTAITLLTLALCIGANTAIFSAVYGLMLKPLPYAEPDRIVEIYNTYPKAGLARASSNQIQYIDYAQNTKSYMSDGLWSQQAVMLGEGEGMERIQAARTTADFFTVLGLKPLIGQFFTAENHVPAADKVVVLTESFWESRFNRRPDVIGQTLRLDGETVTIVGVAPRAFEAFDARVRLVRAASWPPQALNPNARHGNGPQLFARLKPGATLGEAQAEGDMLEKRYYDSAQPQTRAFLDRSGHRIAITGVQEERIKPIKSQLWLLQGGVLFVLLIGCVNVANLLLARANGRQAELAIRFALGATRGQIARQLLTESIVLTLLGTALGLGVAWAAVRLINVYVSDLTTPGQFFTSPGAHSALAIDGRVLGFTAALSLAVMLLISLLPIVHVLRTNLMELIHRSTRTASGGIGIRTWSSVLIVGQVAVALVLLTGAGLLIRSFRNALAVAPGFDPQQVTVTRIAIPGAYRGNQPGAAGFQARLRQALEEIGGVAAVGLSSGTPFQGGLPVNAFTLFEDTLPPGSPQPGAYRVLASPEYASALKLSLVEGRFFEPTDIGPDKRFFVVDENFARKYFPDKSALGGRFSFGNRPEKDSDWPTIIGVVRNVPHNGVEDRSGIPFIYQLLQPQTPPNLTVFVRSTQPPAQMLALMRQKLKAIDPALILFESGALQDAIDNSFNNRRAIMMLLGSFAALAMFLSGIGIFGVLAYDVSQRTQEIGIRGAIGASREQVVGMIFRQGIWKSGLGLVIGLVGAVLLSRYMTTLLYDVKPTDAMAYVSTAGLLLAIAALASYLPARRAAKIDPIIALRQE